MASTGDGTGTPKTIDWAAVRSNLRRRRSWQAALGILVLATVALVGGLAFGGSSVTVTGQVTTTKVYSDELRGGLPAPKCGPHEVHVKDGAGAVLHVGKSEIVDQSLSAPDGTVHTLICTASYSFEVSEADVYNVSVPGAEKVSTFGIFEQTMNRDGKDVVAVDPIDYMYDS